MSSSKIRGSTVSSQVFTKQKAPPEVILGYTEAQTRLAKLIGQRNALLEETHTPQSEKHIDSAIAKALKELNAAASERMKYIDGGRRRRKTRRHRRRHRKTLRRK